MEELNRISKQNPFKVPENYFEEINRKILTDTAGTDSGSIKKNMIRKLRPYFAIAASIASLVVLSYIASRFISRSGNIKGLHGISSVEFQDSYINDIDILTLEENVSASGLLKERPGFNNNDIVDYLVLENIDIYDIYEQL